MADGGKDADDDDHDEKLDQREAARRALCGATGQMRWLAGFTLIELLVVIAMGMYTQDCDEFLPETGLRRCF